MFNFKSRISAAALLISSLSVLAPAEATESVAEVTTCSTGQNVLFRTVGHPGKTALFPARTLVSQGRCDSDTDDKLMMVSFVDAAGGQALLTGRADRAIRQIFKPEDAASPVLAFSNLCVANTVLNRWEDALPACDAAVNAAERNKERYSRWPGEQRRLANKVAAAAYSNRAVMHWMADDAFKAQTDFARARTIAPKAAFVVRNAELSMRLPAQLRQEGGPTG